LWADEKITWLNGEEVVVATTVGDDCLLGVSVALEADTSSPTEAYQQFKDEAQTLNPDYAPETVNTDGWGATQKAWLSLFPMIIIIECFLHAYINGQEILCRIMIVANDEVAIFAMENMLSKFQVLKRSTVGAFARGSFPSVNFDNGLSVLEGNPFQNVHEAVKA
jgi:hypothetical protein